MPSKQYDRFGELVNQVVDRRDAPQAETAIIHGIDFERVDIQLPGSRTVLRHVEVVGDVTNLQVGDEVVLRWKKNRPVVLVEGVYQGTNLTPDNESLEDSTYGLRIRMDGVGLEHCNFDPALAGHVHADTDEIVGGTGIMVTGTEIKYVSLDLDLILLIKDDGTVDEFELGDDNVGIENVFEEAVSGDIILLPSKRFALTNDYIIDGGVTITGRSRKDTHLNWTSAGEGLQLGQGCELRNLTLESTELSTNPAEIHFAIRAMGDTVNEPINLFDVDIIVSSPNGAGAYGIKAETGDMNLYNCDIYANAPGAGAGYGIAELSTNTGKIRLYGGRVRGSTAPFGVV